jgi:signal recognition particle receptor subunit beta
LLLKLSADFAFQNFFSKSSIDLLIFLNNLNLSNIKAHENIEHAINKIITNFTTKSAHKKSFHRVKSVAPPSPTT